MSTKAQLDTKIAGFTSGGANTAAEFRSYETDVVASGYQTEQDSNGTETVTTKVATASIPYQIVLSKSFQLARCVGYFKVNYSQDNNQVIFTFKDTDWLPLDQQFGNLTNVIVNFKAYDRVYNSTLDCQLIYLAGVATVRTLGAIPAFTAAKWDFDFTYNLAK